MHIQLRPTIVNFQFSKMQKHNEMYKTILYGYDHLCTTLLYGNNRAYKQQASLAASKDQKRIECTILRS